VIRRALKIVGMSLAVVTATWAQESTLRTVHVFVALADNQHQGIVPVAAILGNGEDALHNLYWGSAYGVKTFFGRSADWAKINCSAKPKAEILNAVFLSTAQRTFIWLPTPIGVLKSSKRFSIFWMPQPETEQTL
jgi:hypothetical protein